MDRDPFTLPNVMIITVPQPTLKHFFVPFGTRLYLYFTASGVFSDTDVDDDEFVPALPDKTHFEVNDLWGPALPNPHDKDGDKVTFYFTPDNGGADGEKKDSPADALSGGGVIHPGGGGMGDLFVEFEHGKDNEVGEEFKEILCECWPCTKRFLNFVLSLKSLPIPVPARDFLKLLVVSGDKAYAALCKHGDK
jgi:hypothetical protein